MKNMYVVGTMKEILTIDDLGNVEEIETFETEELVMADNKKYSIYVEYGVDVNGDMQYKYISTKLA